MRLFLALLFAVPAFACSCAPLPNFCSSPPPSAQSDESAIFVGTLQSITPDRLASFRVDEAFVGSLGPTFEFNAGSGQCCDCSMRGLAAGEQYLIVAQRWKGKWTTSYCSGSATVREAAHNVQSLRAWKKGHFESPTIYGIVHNMPKDTPLRIQLNGVGIERETTADADGNFSFPDLFPAKYTLKVLTPGWLLFSGDAQPVDLTETRCTHIGIHVRAAAKR